VFRVLTLWLVWRAVRVIVAVVVIVGLLALVAHGHQGSAHLGDAPLTQLRHAVPPVERQIERAIERALTR
jgi:hypothetical protein